jgi:hypothetical protein
MIYPPAIGTFVQLWGIGAAEAGFAPTFTPGRVLDRRLAQRGA